MDPEDCVGESCSEVGHLFSDMEEDNVICGRRDGPSRVSIAATASLNQKTGSFACPRGTQACSSHVDGTGATLCVDSQTQCPITDL